MAGEGMDSPRADEVEVEAPGLDLSSHFDALRKRREQMQEVQTLDLDIPGYGGMLVARYTMLGWDRVQRIAQRWATSKDPDAQLKMQMDTLIAALQQLCVRKDGKVIPIDDETPVRFDNRIADIMQLGETTSAREVVRALFVHEMYVVDQFQDLNIWMRGMAPDVEDEIEGNSPGPRQ